MFLFSAFLHFGEAVDERVSSFRVFQKHPGPIPFLYPAGTACDSRRESELIFLAAVFNDLLAASIRELRIQILVDLLLGRQEYRSEQASLMLPRNLCGLKSRVRSSAGAV